MENDEIMRADMSTIHIHV